jgi:hypothetical protein
VADSLGGSKKTIAELSDYAAYGWHSDKYLLVTKNGSELYIMDVKGSQPLKITNFQPNGS